MASRPVHAWMEKGGDVVHQAVYDADRDKPGNQGRPKPDSGPYGDRAAVVLVGAHQSRRNRGEHQNALKTLAKHQHRDIEGRHRRTLLARRGIGVSVSGNCLPYQHRGDHQHPDCQSGNRGSREPSMRIGCRHGCQANALSARPILEDPISLYRDRGNHVNTG